MNHLKGTTVKKKLELKGNRELTCKCQFVHSKFKVLSNLPPGYTSSYNYLMNVVKKTFDSSFSVCSLKEKCLKPKKTNMIFCEQCRQWFHNDCMPGNDRTILSDTSFYCNNFFFFFFFFEGLYFFIFYFFFKKTLFEKPQYQKQEQ